MECAETSETLFATCGVSTVGKRSMCGCGSPGSVEIERPRTPRTFHGYVLSARWDGLPVRCELGKRRVHLVLCRLVSALNGSNR